MQELEASYQAIQAARCDRVLALRLLGLRAEGLSWIATLEALVDNFLP